VAVLVRGGATQAMGGAAQMGRWKCFSRDIFKTVDRRGYAA
jgi:hypothetical protein